jgi:hypothetical protein
VGLTKAKTGHLTNPLIAEDGEEVEEEASIG